MATIMCASGARERGVHVGEQVGIEEAGGGREHSSVTHLGDEFPCKQPYSSNL